MNKNNFDNRYLLSETIAVFRTSNTNRYEYDNMKKSELTFLMLIRNMKPPVNSIALKEYLNCTKAYISKVVSELMEKDLVEMKQSEIDGRRYDLELTKKGLSYVDKYMDLYTKRTNYLYDKLGEEKSMELINLLNESMNILKEYDHKEKGK